MDGFSAGKSDRLLTIYSLLVSGAVLTKRELVQQFWVTEKSIQRGAECSRLHSIHCGTANRILARWAVNWA